MHYNLQSPIAHDCTYITTHRIAPAYTRLHLHTGSNRMHWIALQYWISLARKVPTDIIHTSAWNTPRADHILISPSSMGTLQCIRMQSEVQTSSCRCNSVHIRVVHGSLFLDPTRPAEMLTRPDPRLPTKSLTRPDPRLDPSPICIVFNWIIIFIN